MDPTNNSHYIRHVTELGNHHKVIANEDIYLANGSKLLAQGKAITPDTYLRIIQHKLVKPIDSSVTLENALAPQTLSEDIAEQLKDNPLLASMNKDSALNEQLTEFAQLEEITQPLFIKLTVLKNRMPGIYRHSLDVASAAVYLGIKTGLDEHELPLLFISGLFHDIGILHIDPEIFNHQGLLSEEQRRSIYSHPIISSLIIQPFTRDSDIARAIIQHHEHCDGTGYPKGLYKAQLDIKGQLLAIAELAISLQDHSSPLPHEHRLGAILKFNYTKYAEEGTRTLLKLFHDNYADPEHPPITLEKDEFKHLLSSVWSIIVGWGQLQKKASNVPQEMRNYIDHQLTTVEQAMVRSGLSQSELEDRDEYLEALLERPCEIMAILNEAMYQFNNTIHELTRRWPDIALDKKLVTAVNDWIDSANDLMGNQTADESAPDFTVDSVP